MRLPYRRGWPVASDGPANSAATARIGGNSCRPGRGMPTALARRRRGPTPQRWHAACASCVQHATEHAMIIAALAAHTLSHLAETLRSGRPLAEPGEAATGFSAHPPAASGQTRASAGAGNVFGDLGRLGSDLLNLLGGSQEPAG